MTNSSTRQLTLFPSERPASVEKTSSTFVENLRLPVHRWFRYSAGFSARWVEDVVRTKSADRQVRVFDPFAGSGTTLLAAQDAGAQSIGIESHPFVYRIATAKLARISDPAAYRAFSSETLAAARSRHFSLEEYPPLVRKCYRDDVLADLDRLRQALLQRMDGSPASELTWLTLVSILRSTSHVGTATWQYVLPRKSKRNFLAPFHAFEVQAAQMHRDMVRTGRGALPEACLIPSDARSCESVPDRSANLVITSPPYPNNYDYADATRLEMSFLQEIRGWGDLQNAVRKHLVRSCSQHVPESAVNLESTLAATELAPIRDTLGDVCRRLAEVRLTKGGKKTYHLMVASYFLDLAQTWAALRRVCDSPCDVCFVVGDSAPYGVYVPVIEWLGKLAVSSGFDCFEFEKTRDRNVKWKNRKHRVPLCEGRLWVKG